MTHLKKAMIGIGMLLMLVVAPAASADPVDEYPYCEVFWYSLDPPHPNVEPDCLFPLPATGVPAVDWAINFVLGLIP